MKRCFALFLAFIVLFLSPAPEVGAAGGEKEQFDVLVQPLLEYGYTVGVVVAVINGDEVQIFGYGTISADSKKAPDGNTVFDIGSVTKTFTALLLAEMAERGRVDLDDPVQKHLPDSVSVPQHGKREITLLDLATHTSGLPRIPANFEMADPTNPYKDYTEKKMYEFLPTYKLPRAPGETYEYSNLGAGFLGHVLGRCEDKNYETLVAEKICGPLGMKDTVIHLSQSQLPRLAQGHDLEGNPTPMWDFSVLKGCGALRSTANDMVKYLKAYMGFNPELNVRDINDTPLSSALALSHTPRYPGALPGWFVGMAWNVNETGDIAWHDGGTGGFFSFIGFDKKRKFGIVWLSNSTLWQMVPLRERLEQILLDKPAAPLKLRKAIKIDPEILGQYVGNYQFESGVVRTISLVEGYLIMGTQGQEYKTVFYPESETDFFLLEAETLNITFGKDEKGNVTKLIFSEGEDGEETAGERIGE